jgi:hypothetical protein
VSTLVIAQGLLIYGLLGWKLAHLARAPRDPPLRCVTACLACAAAAYPFGIMFASHTVAPAARWLMVMQSSLLLGVMYCLGCFFLYSLLAPAIARQRARRRALALATAVGTLITAAAVTPAAAAMNDQSAPAVGVAYVIFDVAMGYFLTDAGRQALRGMKEVHGPTARGLRLVFTGITLMVASLVLFVTAIAMHLARANPPAALGPAGQVLVLPGIVTLLAGVSYPGTVMRVSALRLWNRRRRTYHELAPLWTALHEAFPQDTLSRMPSSRWHDALSPWSVHRRFYRRVIECRDGLVRLSPYLDLPSGRADAALASRLITALQAQGTTTQVLREPVLVAVPEGSGLDADADELARLSRYVAGRSTAPVLPLLPQPPSDAGGTKDEGADSRRRHRRASRRDRAR